MRAVREVKRGKVSKKPNISKFFQEVSFDNDVKEVGGKESNLQSHETIPDTASNENSDEDFLFGAN